MKPIFVVIISIVLLIDLYSQETAYKSINANYVLTSLTSKGSMFSSDLSSASFSVPHVGGQSSGNTMYIGNLWMSGVDNAGNTFATLGTYGNDSYTYGMIEQSTGLPYQEVKMNQDRVWSITRTAIEQLVLDALLGNISMSIDRDILEWPARGNPYYEGLFDDRDGAPFFDSNNDGMYNPYHGDYPTIGDDLVNRVPDQIVMSVTNDSKPDQFRDMGLEIYTMLYAFYCEDDEDVNSSIFQRQIVYNRSDLEYKDVRVGHFFDPNLGCGEDDYIGCDSLNNVFYIYNEDEQDGDVGDICTSGASIFEDSPVHIVKVLDQGMSSFSYYGNGDLSPEPLTNPAWQILDETDVFDFCSGIWTNGEPITTGGYGYNPNSVQYTNYAFHGNPNNTDSWSMYSEDLESNRWRIVAGQEFSGFGPGSKIVLNLVHTYVQSDIHDHIQTIDVAIESANHIEEVYSNKFINQCDQIPECISVACVAPGDVNNNEVVERMDFMLLGLATAKVGAFQSPRNFISSEWKLHNEQLREESFKNGVNYSHADCNGDGLVDWNDLQTVELNIGNQTDYYQTHIEECTPYIGPGSLNFNWLPLALQSSEIADISPIFIIENFAAVHSLSFRLRLDNGLVVRPGIASSIVAGCQVGTNLGMVNIVDGVEEYTMIYGGIDNVPIEHEQCFVRLQSTGMSSQSKTSIRIEDILIMDAEENFYCMDDLVFDIDFSDLSSTSDVQEYNLTIFPNPTSTLITINCNAQLYNYRILTLQGDLLQSGRVPVSKTLEVESLASGLYILELELPGSRFHFERIAINL